jgi:hypothetical protein
MSLRRLTGIAAGVALAASAFAPTAASADASELACRAYLNPYALNVPGYTNCMIDLGLTTAVRVANCTMAYDPYGPPLSAAHVQASTAAYVDCLA